MTLMRERGITHVLTNDHHFRQEGFTVLSDAP
jgi:predicted nucleic acid-binding protein